MTDAQKALEDCFFSTQHFTDENKAWEFVKHYEHEIRRALRLLAAVEGGTHKVVPVEPDECMVYAADLAQEPFCDVDVYPTRDLLKAAIRAAIYAAPDFFAEDK